MLHKEVSKGNGFLTCENYIANKDISIITNFFEIAAKLKISILVIDDLNIKERDSILNDISHESYPLFSSKLVYENIKAQEHILEILRDEYKKFIQSNNLTKSLLVSRKTLKENSVDKIKKQLGNIRHQYEVISLLSDNKNTMKWAANERRIDYITIEILENSELVDSSLCSVVKQNNKAFEVVLFPLIDVKNERELSEILRKGKKLMDLIRSGNAPYIFTMKPKIPLDLRTGSQMRLLGNLFGVSYNKTKSCVFDKQLEVLINNTIKLHETHIFEGVKEV